MTAIVEPTYRGLVKLATPVVISMISLTVMGIVDTLIVGFLGTEPLAAVGFVVMLGMNVFAFATGFMGAVTTIVSQSFGAKDFFSCRTVVWQALFFSVLLGIVYGGLSFFVGDLLRFMRLSPEVQNFGTLYGRWYLAGGFFVAFNQAMTGFFQGISNTKIPMIVAVIANLVNAVLCWVLVLGWQGSAGFGVVGAAWGTLIASALSSVLFWFFFRWNSLGREELQSNSILNFAMFRRLAKLGFPIGSQMFLGIASFLVFYIFVGWLGDTMLAANRIVLQMDQLAFMPVIGLAQATQVVVGQYLGARQPVVAKQMAHKAILLGFVMEVSMGFLYLLFAGPIVRFFSQDPVVVHLGITILHFALIWMVFDAVIFISLFALRGAGDVRWTLAAVLLIGYGVRLPLIYVLAFTLGYGFFGAWVGLIFGFILLSLVLYGRFASGRWMKRYETSGLVPETSS